MRRSFVGVGLFLFAVAACSHESARTERVASSSQPLIAEPEQIKGEDLGEKELVFTFDDGPGSMNTTGRIADFLAAHNPPIVATFFVNGSCIKATDLSDPECTPRTDAKAILDKIRAGGHIVANHATTHRGLIGLPAGEVLKELTQTDDAIKDHLVFNLPFFRAPFGAWDDATFAAVSGSPMNKYVGPIYWTAGGDSDFNADWACFNGGGGFPMRSTSQCGDKYIEDIERQTKKNGIILFHDPYGNPANGLDTVPGSTATMIEYIVPKLDAAGYKYKSLADVPAVRALLPKCDATCGAECKGPAPTDCLKCPDGKAATDGKCGGGTASSTSSSGSSGNTSNGDPSTSSSSGATNPGGIKQTPNEAAPEEEGCNTTGGSSGGAAAALLALATALTLRSKRRRA